MSTIKIKQVKSRIGAPADQKRTLDALGLRKLDRKSTRLNSSHLNESRMPSSA